MPNYQPPFVLSHQMLSHVADIAELLGRWKQAHQHEPVPRLRRDNRIQTIHASLAIEQNTLTIEQVTAVLDGKAVLGHPKEIQEVLNAFAAYEALSSLDPTHLDDLLQAHGLLMQGLVVDAGQFRASGVGIYRGQQLVHMAPPATQLTRLMGNLMTWLSNSDAHPLIASCAFHYELEFIHPFSDGNGRIGRLWQTLILSRWQPILAYLPIETVIKQQQSEYYHMLSLADQSADCSGFIEFMLSAIRISLQQAVAAEDQTEMRVEKQVETRVEHKPDTASQILALLSVHPEYTLVQVAQHLNRATSTVERAVTKLKQQERLRYIGSRKAGYWEVIENREE